MCYPLGLCRGEKEKCTCLCATENLYWNDIQRIQTSMLVLPQPTVFADGIPGEIAPLAQQAEAGTPEPFTSHSVCLPVPKWVLGRHRPACRRSGETQTSPWVMSWAKAQAQQNQVSDLCLGGPGEKGKSVQWQQTEWHTQDSRECWKALAKSKVMVGQTWKEGRNSGEW